MEDIIKSIIDIDRDAAHKLEDAEKEKLRIISAAKAEEERIVSNAVDSAKTELEKLEAEKKRSTDQRIKELQEETRAGIEALKRSFDKNSDKWCSEIFEAVISH